MKKSFKSRVINVLKKENWEIEEVNNSSIIDFIASHSRTLRKAYYTRPHGHLRKAEVDALQNYGRTHKMHVLYAHESEEHEIRFVRLYPRVEK